MFLVPFFVLFLGACSSESTENYTQMLGAFERNDSELSAMLDEAAENINSDSNREKALKSINENIIPSIDDFRQTVSNYTLADKNHIEVQEAMIDYLNEVEDLMGLYSSFNEEFFFVNPLGDDSIDATLNEEMDKISRQEEDMQSARTKVHELIGENEEE